MLFAFGYWYDFVKVLADLRRQSDHTASTKTNKRRFSLLCSVWRHGGHRGQRYVLNANSLFVVIEFVIIRF